MAKSLMKPVSLFVPITRVDEEQRTVEGYCFVNEVVEGEGGIRIKRSAMEEATPEYMEWGAVRAMHQPLAAGTATAPGCGVEWDEKGAFFRAKIVDDNEWKKCVEKVYKGFSVSIYPRVMRGKDVEKLCWVENSLVDRPKDPDAKITLARAADAQEEYEVEVLEDEQEQPTERAASSLSFSELIAKNEPDTLRCLAFDLLRYVLWQLARTQPEGADQLARDSIAQFADYIVPTIMAPEAAADDDYYYAAEGTVSRLLQDAEGQSEELREALGNIQRQREAQPLIERVEVPDEPEAPAVREEPDTINRLETAAAELTRVQGLLSTAEAEIQRLKSQPAPLTAPVRYPAALSREFTANQATGAVSREETFAEIRRIEDAAKTEQSQHKRQEYAAKILELQQRLAVPAQETITR